MVLCEALSFDYAWEEIIKGWFIEKNERVRNLPRAVVVPNDATVQFIKEQLLKLEIPLLGVHFFTPGKLRHYLAKAYGVVGTAELRENLQLLMKSVASGLKENRVANAAEINPDQFVRLADLLDSAGWGSEVLKNQNVRELIAKYREAQEFYGVITTQRMVDGLYDLTKNSKEVFSDLLLYGFSSKYWSNYKLLVAAVRSAYEGTICLLTQNSTRVVDQAWLGSWEEEFGFSIGVLGGLESKPFSYLSYLFEEENISKEIVNKYSENLPEIYVADTILKEAEVIVAVIAEALVNEETTRVGIVFPNETSPLAREVAIVLEKERISHYNHLGYLGGRSRKRQLFELWVKWQKSVRLENLFNFLDALTDEGILSIEQFQQYKKNSRLASQTLLTDDIVVINNYLKLNLREKLVIKSVDDWRVLPDEGTFQDYMKLAGEALKEIISAQDWKLTEQRAGLFLQNFERMINKEDFLLWISSVTKVLGRTSHYWGQQQYALVHLVTEEEALMQSWSHLILAGINQGEWPSEKPEVMFLESKYIHELNHASLKEGMQGDGHSVVRDGLSLLVSSSDHYEMSKVNFGVLLGSPSKKLVITAHMTNPQQAKESLMSEFLEKLYHILEGKLLDVHNVKTILKNTNFWIRDYALEVNKDRYEEVENAYKHRRNIKEGFNEYSFCFRKPKKEALNISCKAWEEVLASPERVWFKHILKIESQELLLGKGLHSLAKGTWVHAWINLEKKGGQISVEVWKELIENQARKVYETIEKTYSSLNRTVPDIWKSYWHEARRVSVSLCNAVKGNLNDGYLFSEYPISDENNSEFFLNIPLKGRIDLLIYGLNDLSYKDELLCIFDFKTGVSGALTKDKLKRGVGIQLVLYALKFYKEGFKQIEVSVIQPGVALKKQLDLNDILETRSIFEAINYVYLSGKLGIRNSMESNYESNFKFPIATIKVEDEVLEKKWGLTHENLTFNL